MEHKNRWFPKPTVKAIVRDLELKDYLTPFVDGQPILLSIEGSDDYFAMVFSTEPLLRNRLGTVARKIFGVNEIDYSIKQIMDAREFCESVWAGSTDECKIRIMIDPEFVSDHHTKWKEPFRDEAGMYKYIQQQKE